MRIGCLQFAPNVGDVDNNIRRADQVLSRAKQDDLYNLDMIVLPELAFSGYNFKSLQHISDFLEPTTSGISGLWARTVALKYGCTVAVGYPEKVDVSTDWPTSPRYYNSLVVVNDEGETVANYRKTFLYYTDETWALEGSGFYDEIIPGLGSVAMGICMDINPYRFEAPWHAFEFAFHILEVEASLVIISMAWLTREEAEIFSRFGQDPDMETVTYWIQRLEPVIRAETEEEIIVVFCNRCGVEDDAVYAGTSTVIGIHHGEVKLYGILGRGEEELLVVDTDRPPFAKLVKLPEDEADSVANDRGSAPDNAEREPQEATDDGDDSRDPSAHSEDLLYRGNTGDAEHRADDNNIISDGLMTTIEREDLNIAATTKLEQQVVNAGTEIPKYLSPVCPSPRSSIALQTPVLSPSTPGGSSSPQSRRRSRLSWCLTEQEAIASVLPVMSDTNMAAG